MKRFAVRIQEGARPHLRIVRANGPDEAAREVVRRLDSGPDRLLGAKIAVWEHGKLHKNMSPLFIKSLDPFETTPDIHVVQAIREERRKTRWLETKARAEKMKEEECHHVDEPFERWIDEFSRTKEEIGGDGGFFDLPLAVRSDCLDLRDRLKHVSPGEMSPAQARFASIVSSFPDLYRYEMHAIQERLSETLEVMHHRLAGLSDTETGNAEELPPFERLAHLIGISTRSASDLGRHH